VLVKDSEHPNLTVKAVAKILNAKEIQVYRNKYKREAYCEMLRGTDGMKRKAGSENVNDFE
jgi:hypothetical protein